MVDFKKHLKGLSVPKTVNPIELYETLDRAHDKGPLRPAQQAVLSEWFTACDDKRDAIIKLHTGQGKTLVGLLILQSRINAAKGPSVYLCPNNYLVKQTCEQAKQFGIPTCEAAGELPGDFLDGRAILVTSVDKLFNGLTKFGLNRDTVEAGTVLMDDAHACSDRIRSACAIRLSREDDAYQALLELFSAELEPQGAGTFADIKNKAYDALLPVPYWAWAKKESGVATILSKYKERRSIKFAWPLLKDMLAHCQCIVSGTSIEIEPYVPPLECFGTYWKANHRVFMSATVTDDAFLVKGLRISPDTITNPITYAEEQWSGEKMMLLPSLVDSALTRSELVHVFAKPLAARTSGLVALVSSFSGAIVWEKCGARLTDKNSLNAGIKALQSGAYEEALILVNQYDGIDLPDDTCRILVFDGKPHSQSLTDLYQESCRPSSDPTLMRVLRTIEQGLGRSVRGEKDFSVVVLLGTALTRMVRDRRCRDLVSSQLNSQIEIGLEVARLAALEIKKGDEPKDALRAVIMQCLSRDDGWKAFYRQEMEKVRPIGGANEALLQAYVVELSAEGLCRRGDVEGASSLIQELLDSGDFDDADHGWYLQEMARFKNGVNRSEAQKLQALAHRKNHMLLRPAHGTTVSRLQVVSEGRMNRIIEVIKGFGTYEQLNLQVTDVLGQLVFGIRADPFEQALNELAKLLGLNAERPDREWKEGPDNLFALDDSSYLVIECKSEVEVKRSEIHKREAEQMNRSCAWFEKHYENAKSRNLLVIPTHVVQSAAQFTHPVEVVRSNELKRLRDNVRGFFSAFAVLDFKDLTPGSIQKLVDAHELDTNSLLTKYGKQIRHQKNQRA